MQVGVEEEEVIIFPIVLLSKAILVEVPEEIINSLNSCKVSVWFALLTAPETGFSRLEFYLEQTWKRTSIGKKADKSRVSSHKSRVACEIKLP